MAPSIGDVLRQPEYTGENRCEPCTVLNLLIAAVLGWLVSRRSRLGGVLAVAVSTVLIYFRGYLVPGTPALTKRYLPPTVLRWFGKDPEPDVASGFGGAVSNDDADTDAASASEDAAAPSSDERDAEDDASGGTATETDATAETESPDEFDLETHLVEHGVLEPCEGSEDLCLVDEFESAWFDELDPLVDADGEVDVDVDDVVEAFGIGRDPEFELVKYNDGLLLRSGTTHVGTWPSRSALAADVAASRIADRWLPDWEGYDAERKGQILNGLRMFLERCPGGGGVSMTEEAVQSCCRPHTVFAVVCEESGERLFEHAVKGT